MPLLRSRRFLSRNTPFVLLTKLVRKSSFGSECSITNTVFGSTTASAVKMEEKTSEIEYPMIKLISLNSLIGCE